MSLTQGGSRPGSLQNVMVAERIWVGRNMRVGRIAGIKESRRGIVRMV